MARPLKNNCEYYPHFTTMRNHRKVKALRNKFGSVLGYAFWSMFIEYLTELDGNEFEFTNVECEMFAGELGVSAAEIQSLISYCLDIELLFKDEQNFIYSDSLNDYLKPVYEKREREREKSKARQRQENGAFCKHKKEPHGVSAAEIPQGDKLNGEDSPQRKEKKRKEYYLSIFDASRKIYPGKKRGNETEFENFTKKHKDWENVINLLKSAIESQIKDVNGKTEAGKWVPEWANFQTWINQRRWEMTTEIKPTDMPVTTQPKMVYMDPMTGEWKPLKQK